MATLIACADGNFTAAATWATAAQVLDTESNFVNAATAPSWTSGSNLATGVITIDGIAVKMNTRSGTPAGTFSVRLYNVTGGAAVAGTTVTVNVSDFANAAGAAVGWMFFKFAAPVALAAATNYRVEAQVSNAAQVSLFRDATANNICRMLRTTTTAAPGAGDTMFVLGEWTAAATKTNRVVTMDETAATDYGAASTTIVGFQIGNGGTLQYAFTAATNYVLRLSAIMAVSQGGTFTMGTVANPIPRDSTAVLEFDNAADGQFGLRNYGTVVMQGLSRTAGKNVVGCLLSADEAAGQTVLSVDTDTGWLSGDEIAVFTTTRVVTQSEEATLNGAATATEVTISAGLTNAHAGTDPLQAEVVLLTRNVMFRSVSTTFSTYFVTRLTGTADVDWVGFRYVGGTATWSGIEFDSTGTYGLDYCSMRDGDYVGVTRGASVTQAVTWTHNVLWKASGATQGAIELLTSTANVTIEDTYVGAITTTTARGLYANGSTAGPAVLTLRRVRVAGGVNGIDTIGRTDVLMEDVSARAGNQNLLITSARSMVATDIILARSTGSNLAFSNVTGRCLFNRAYLFGASASGANVQLLNAIPDVTFRNAIIAGDTTYPTQNGFESSQANVLYRIRLENCQIGVASGIYAAHTGADFGGTATGPRIFELTLINTTLGSATEFDAAMLAGIDATASGTFIARHRKDGSTNVHEKLYVNLGTVSYDTTTFRTASPSEKLEPTGCSVTRRLPSGIKRFPVLSGRAAIVSVYVRKNGTYNGTAPRLILKANPALGVDDDLVLDTLSVGADTWEQLTGTSTPVAEEDGVLEAYVDCDGTAGAVFVDDWSATLA